MILGAFTLNTWASALLYEPVEKHLIPAKKKEPEILEEEDEEEEEQNATIPTITAESDDKKWIATSPQSLVVPKSASSVALENYKNTPIQNRTRKISMPAGSVGHREMTGQMHSTPALHVVPERGGENMRSFRRRAPTLSPSVSSFNYISTPFHGSTLSALHPEFASNLTLNAITSTFRKSPEKSAKKDEPPPIR